MGHWLTPAHFLISKSEGRVLGRAVGVFPQCLAHDKDLESGCDCAIAVFVSHTVTFKRGTRSPSMSFQLRGRNWSVEARSAFVSFNSTQYIREEVLVKGLGSQRSERQFLIVEMKQAHEHTWIFGVGAKGSGDLNWLSKFREDFGRETWGQWQEVRLQAEGAGGAGWDAVGK